MHYWYLRIFNRKKNFVIDFCRTISKLFWNEMFYRTKKKKKEWKIYNAFLDMNAMCREVLFGRCMYRVFFLVYGLCTGLLCLVGVCASPRGYEVCAQKSGGWGGHRAGDAPGGIRTSSRYQGLTRKLKSCLKFWAKKVFKSSSEVVLFYEY